MRIDVIMPQMGESIQEGTIVKWLKAVGDPIGRDEPLFEISTDKVDAEIPSPSAGILAAINVQPGETVAIKTVVGVIESEAGKAAAAPAAGSGAARGAPAPPAGISPAPAARPSPQVAPAPVRSTGGAISPPAARGPAVAPAASGSSVAVLEERLRTKSSPVVRRIAAEHGLDIASLTGTGISGRVTKNDILGYIETKGGDASAGETARLAGAAASLSPALEGPRAYPAFQPGERFERVPMSPMRRKIAEHMVASKRISAHVTTWFEIDMSRIGKIRETRKQGFSERHGVNLTYMPFIMKATVDALQAFPALNASIDGADVLYKKDVNLGVAVALDWGLIVPVVKSAQDLSLPGLAKAVADLAARARSKQLKPEEVQGGTFTITNPGIFGSLMGTPIINQPQVAILGVGTIEKRPVVIDDAIAIRTMSTFSISFDHRIVDGALADQFMAQIKKALQEFDESTV